MKSTIIPIGLLCMIFLTVGSMFCMNDILLPAMINHFGLNYAQATMIQLSFYITYILFPLPVAWMIHRFGYKISLAVALLISSLGCAMMIPAHYLNSYALVLTGIFILSTGITVINVAANPFVSLLGKPEGVHIRMNFVQVFSRIGYATTPLVATVLIYTHDGTIRFHYPYMWLSIIIFSLAVLLILFRIPSFRAKEEDKFSIKGIFHGSYRFRHLFFGVFAMFFYLGVESCTAGFFIPYLTDVMQFSKDKAAGFLSMYYVFAAAMGLAAVGLLKFIKAHRLVGFFGICMIACYLYCILLQSEMNGYILAALGLFLSVMFPTLFSLALEGTGSFAGNGSAMLNFAIVGGSVFPPIQGLIADRYGVSISFWVPCFCTAMIVLYAFYFTRDSNCSQRKTLKN